MSARVIQVIEVVHNRGLGIPSDPVRNVTQYWSLDGQLLADVDTWKSEEELTSEFGSYCLKCKTEHKSLPGCPNCN